MFNPSPSPPRHHVLLVGIDAYEALITPLHGCVNDVDAIEAILLDRLAIPAAAITKLASPHADHPRAPRLPEREATAANLRAALLALTTEGVSPGDRVLIYYAGHGTQLLSRRNRIAREALVPIDVHSGGDLLYDAELNDLLRRIALRTGDLNVILDCCCSAGATRALGDEDQSAVRFCKVDESKIALPSALATRSNGEPGLLGSLDPSDPGYLVVAACQANERAHEGRRRHGERHGAFTAALLDRIAAEPDHRLHDLRWADIWSSLRERVALSYPGQHPYLIGRAERRLFGGPFMPHDPGISVSRVGGEIRLAAGSMAGVSLGARLAVYGPTPEFFPPLRSAEDAAARLGVLEVTAATLASATARPLGAAIKLPEGARARVITPGEANALVVQLDPYDDDLAGWLAARARLRFVRAGEEALVEAFVGMDAAGQRWIGDALFGPGAEPPLATMTATDHEALLDGLMHYARYHLPLRLAARCRDLPGALRVCLLDAEGASSLTADEAQDPKLPELPADPEHRYRYRVEERQAICLVVENRSPERLYANLFNCATSGRVESLGPTQIELPPGRKHAFWRGGNLGAPFHCSIPDTRRGAVDRIVAIATTLPDVDLSFLRERRSFAETLRSRSRDLGPDEGEPRARWTASLVTLNITRPGAPAPAGTPAKRTVTPWSYR